MVNCTNRNQSHLQKIVVYSSALRCREKSVNQSTYMYMKQMCNRKHARDLEEGKGKKQQVKRKKEKGIRKRVAAE